MKYFLLITLFFLSSYLMAQTGPGGVGNAEGTNSQPSNLLWLDAGELALTDGATVSSWPDKSGNGNHFGQLSSYNLPVFEANGLASGNHGTVRFDGTERYLSVADNASLNSLSEVSLIVVFKSAALGGARGIIAKRISSGSQNEYTLFTYSGNYLYFDIQTASSSNDRSNTADALSVNTDYIASAVYNGSTKQIFLQSVQSGSTVSKSGTISNGAAPIVLGALNESYGTYFSGDIAEVIMYGYGLNAAQRIIVENYLAEKYGITITNDYYTGHSGAYDQEVAGIGQISSESHDEAGSGGMMLAIYDGSVDDNELILAGHSGTTNSVVTTSLAGVSVARWARDWYVDVTGTSLNAAIGFDFGDGIGGQYPQTASDYRLLKWNGSGYEEVSTLSTYVSDDQLYFRVADPADGYYTLGTVNTSTAPLEGGTQRVWYSYKNGNWQDPLSWTLDGAISALYVNPANEYPTSGDLVVIKSGRTIKMLNAAGTADYNNATVAGLEIIGTLDVGTSYGHALGIVTGSGKIIMKGSSADDTDNLPSGDLSYFTGTSGGTVEIQGDGLNLSTARTFNDLIVNLDGGSTAVLTASYTINGSWSVNSGTVQINNTSTTVRTIDLYGDLIVDADGTITTGTGNARHQFNFYGNFINDGAVAFTQRTSQTTGSEATDGIVDANFLNDTEDQFIQCNNTTRFYRIKIDKGEDDTYVLNIDADDASSFGLYGYASQGHGEVNQLTANSNALGLLKGTVRIGTNVTIQALTVSGNYNVSEAAKLWVDGGSVTMASGNAIVPYGGILVSDGILTAGVSSGITTRGNGYLEVTGGKVKMNQFRTSIYGSENQGGYSQSGGEVYVTGSPSSGSYYSFSSTYEGNTFSMTGGVLTVNANSKGGIFINGSEGNYNVEGGEVVCQIASNSNFVITSKAPFYNLTLRKIANYSRSVILSGGSTSGGTDDVTLDAQPLVVLNDLVIENSSASYINFDGNTTTTGYHGAFNANGVDVTIAGNLDVGSGATFTTGSNTLTFDGTGLSYLSFGTAATQTVNHLIIEKNYSDQGVQILAGNTTTALQINGDLTLTKGKLRYSTFNVSAKGGVYLQDTIGRSGSTGKLIMNGTSAQTLETAGDEAIFNLEINNSSGVTLDGALSVLGTLTLTAGVLDIDEHKLRLTNAVAGSGFGTTKMITTEGYASNDGLELYIGSAGSYLFPVGTDINSSTRYTPVTISLNTFYDNGYVAVSVADQELATLNAAGTNALSYYWSVKHSDFTTLPLLNSIACTYANSDTHTGAQLVTANNYVAGKVINGLPYTRTALASVINGTNVITYDNGGTPYTLGKDNYTAGTANKFSGNIEIFYVRVSNENNWKTGSTWSLTGPDGSSAGDYPKVGDVAVLSYSATQTGSNKRRRVVIPNGNVINIAELVLEQNPDADLVENNLSRLVLEEESELNVSGSISGDGEVQYKVTDTDQPVITYGDIGGFVNTEGASWIVRADYANQHITLPYITSKYPRLSIVGFGGSAFNNSVTFDHDITCDNMNIRYGGTLRMNTGTNGDITVLDSLRLGTIGGQYSGQLQFMNSGTARTFTVGGDLILDSDNSSVTGNSRIYIETGGTESVEHLLQVGGDIIIRNDGSQDGSIDLYDGSSGEANVILELTGENSAEFINETANVPDLYRLIVNKGEDTTSVFTFNNQFLLNGSADDADADDKALVLENGKLVLDDPSIDLQLSSGGADFDIPSTAGLEVSQGMVSVSGDDIGIRLDGLLRINGGTVDMDDLAGNGNNYIEYSSSGAAVLEISAGTLTVGSQIRRGLNSTSGVLNYRQTGGTVIAGKNAAPEITRGVLEVTNSSEFVHTAGSLTLVRGINSSVVPTLLLEPAASDLTGSTITIGSSDTPSGTASNRIGIKSSITLNHLTIDNSSGNNPVVWIYSRPLTVGGTLTNPSGATFNANAYGLTLKGDFVNDGTYTPSGNTTTFSKTSGSQSFTGTGTSTFYNFIKSESGVLNINKDITIDNDFTVSGGTLDLDDHSVFLTGDATVQSTVTTNGGSGIVFQGDTEQQLIGKANQSVTVGTLTIDNAEGVTVPDGNGYIFAIDESLRLSEGVLDIGGSLLTINKNAVIDDVNTFALTNMIQTNSSLSDNGVKKIFNGTETDFVFPVGETKYTPMLLSITSIDEDGYITVRPANEMHPAVTDDPLTAEDETQNALQYHWIVKSDGLTGITSGEAQFIYDQSDVLVTSPYTESDYEPARLIFDQEQWDKAYGTGEVDELINTINFPLSESSSLGGEYTAGINNAFRDVPEYRSTDGIVFSSAAGWEVYDDDLGSWVAATSKPVGARVTILTGHTVTVDESYLRLLSTAIEDGSRLVVDGSTYGARLGEVSGTGRIVLASEVLPAGDYDDFLTCSGGELEYTSSSSYDILSGVSNVKLVALTGSGTRTLPSNAVYICEELDVDGPTLLKNNSSSFEVGGDLNLLSGTIQFASSTANMTVGGTTTLSSGSFTGYSGADIVFNGDLHKTDGSVTFTGNSADFMMMGAATQQVTGSFSINKLTVNNTGGGIDLTGGGNLTISQTLTMTDGWITSSGANKVTLTSTGSHTGASLASYFNGPVTKNGVAASATYTFPVGKGGRYAPVIVSNVASGSQNWTAEYFTAVADASIPTTTAFDTSDPGSGLNALNEIKTSDRWSVSSSGSNSAFVTVTYGSHDGYTDVDEIRITQWDATDARWENIGDIQSGNINSGTVGSAATVSFSTHYFGLGNAPETTLPVDLVYFAGYVTDDGSVVLDWQTASEIENDRFEIERMAKDGSEFEKIGKVAGAGNSEELLDYQFIDQDPYYGINYYRLKQVDYDGMFEYSQIIVVNNDTYQVGIEVTLLPNPTTEDNIKFKLLTGDETTMVNVRVLDLQGRTFFSRDIHPEVGGDRYLISPDKAMPKGMYFLIVTQGRHTEQAKLIIK